MFNRYKGVKMLGMLAIGNGEKCPYCNLTMSEDIDIFKHMTAKHEDKMLKALFGDKDNG